MTTTIEHKQQQIREWMEKNRKKFSRFSFSSPSLKDPICKDPLFKPLLLCECTLRPLGLPFDEKYKDYWFRKIATKQESKFLNDTDDKELAFNLYIGSFGLIHIYYWNKSDYSEHANVSKPDQYWHINIESKTRPLDYENDYRNNMRIRYEICAINGSLYYKYYKLFDKGEGTIDISRLHKGLDLKDNKTREYIEFQSMISHIAGTHSIDAVNDTISFLLEAPIPKYMFETENSPTWCIDLLFEKCSDREAKAKLVSKLTGVDQMQVQNFINIDGNVKLAELIKLADASKTMANGSICSTDITF